MKHPVRFVVSLLIALAIGLSLAWVDSRPGWDDTAVLVGAILVTTAVFGALQPRRAWIWALAIGGWIPLVGIALNQNYGSLLALGIALIGAYGGALIRRVFGG